MTAFAITVDVLAASIHSKTGFISVMSEIEGLLQSATALNICGIPDSIDLDGFRNAAARQSTLPVLLVRPRK